MYVACSAVGKGLSRKNKMKLKDLMLVVIVGVISFPLMYIVLMFATGGMKIVLNQPLPIVLSEPDEVKLVRYDKNMDSLAMVQSKTYQAVQSEKASLADEKKQLAEQQSRIDMESKELDSVRILLATERQKFEKAVVGNDSAEQKRTKKLAGVYGSMPAADAARVIEALQENEAVNILNAISDDRQKAKILSLINPQKAAVLSHRMIGSVK